MHQDVIHLTSKAFYLFFFRKKDLKPGPLPSFLSNRKTKSSSKVPARLFTYDREIICFPKTFLSNEGLIKIPRKKSTREYLIINQLVGNIRLRSDMSEDDIMTEIRSVFSWAMNEDSLFRFKILQSSGGGSKSLSVRQVSSSYQWTASTVAGKQSKSPIYILAKDDLRLVKSDFGDSSDEENGK